MSCTSMTRSRMIRPLLVILVVPTFGTSHSYPRHLEAKPDQAPNIQIVRTVQSDQSGPVVGMAGIGRPSSRVSPGPGTFALRSRAGLAVGKHSIPGPRRALICGQVGRQADRLEELRVQVSRFLGGSRPSRASHLCRRAASGVHRQAADAPARSHPRSASHLRHRTAATGAPATTGAAGRPFLARSGDGIHCQWSPTLLGRRG